MAANSPPPIHHPLPPIHDGGFPAAPEGRAPTPVEAVVFDFDGTLVATRFADEAAVAELIASDPSAAAGAETFWGHEGEPILNRIELAWPGRGAMVLPLFERQAPPRRFPGVVPLLQRLSRRGTRMAVVSSRRRAALHMGLAATGLGEFFPVVVGLEDVQAPKPSPEGLELALIGLGVSPSRAVYIGDNLLDVEAGRRAGMRVWRAAWGLSAAFPNGVVLLRRPSEVLQHLDRARPG